MRRAAKIIDVAMSFGWFLMLALVALGVFNPSQKLVQLVAIGAMCLAWSGDRRPDRPSPNSEENAG